MQLRHESSRHHLACRLAADHEGPQVCLRRSVAAVFLASSEGSGRPQVKDSDRPHVGQRPRELQPRAVLPKHRVAANPVRPKAEAALNTFEAELARRLEDEDEKLAGSTRRGNFTPVDCLGFQLLKKEGWSAVKSDKDSSFVLLKVADRRCPGPPRAPPGRVVAAGRSWRISALAAGSWLENPRVLAAQWVSCGS